MQFNLSSAQLKRIISVLSVLKYTKYENVLKDKLSIEIYRSGIRFQRFDGKNSIIVEKGLIDPYAQAALLFEFSTSWEQFKMLSTQSKWLIIEDNNGKWQLEFQQTDSKIAVECEYTHTTFIDKKVDFYAVKVVKINSEMLRIISKKLQSAVVKDKDSVPSDPLTYAKLEPSENKGYTSIAATNNHIIVVAQFEGLSTLNHYLSQPMMAAIDKILYKKRTVIKPCQISYSNQNRWLEFKFDEELGNGNLRFKVLHSDESKILMNYPNIKQFKLFKDKENRALLNSAEIKAALAAIPKSKNRIIIQLELCESSKISYLPTKEDTPVLLSNLSTKSPTALSVQFDLKYFETLTDTSTDNILLAWNSNKKNSKNFYCGPLIAHDAAKNHYIETLVMPVG
jgi:hypothetical protein